MAPPGPPIETPLCGIWNKPPSSQNYVDRTQSLLVRRGHRAVAEVKRGGMTMWLYLSFGKSVIRFLNAWKLVPIQKKYGIGRCRFYCDCILFLGCNNRGHLGKWVLFYALSSFEIRHLLHHHHHHLVSSPLRLIWNDSLSISVLYMLSESPLDSMLNKMQVIRTAWELLSCNMRMICWRKYRFSKGGGGECWLAFWLPINCISNENRRWLYWLSMEQFTGFAVTSRLP